MHSFARRFRPLIIGFHPASTQDRSLVSPTRFVAHSSGESKQNLKSSSRDTLRHGRPSILQFRRCNPKRNMCKTQAPFPFSESQITNPTRQWLTPTFCGYWQTRVFPTRSPWLILFIYFYLLNIRIGTASWIIHVISSWWYMRGDDIMVTHHQTTFPYRGTNPPLNYLSWTAFLFFLAASQPFRNDYNQK